MAAIQQSKAEKTFDYLNHIILGLIAVLMLIPLITVLSTSFSNGYAVDRGEVFILPVEFTTATWEKLLIDKPLWMSFWVSVSTTTLGTLLALLITAMLAYPLSKKEFHIAKIVLILVVVTMVFKYPIIPFFLTVRNLGLYDTYWVLILLHIMNPFNLIIMRTFFKGLPVELEEAAKMEGCGYFKILFHIIIPLSKPVMATLGIFYAVAMWNQYMHPLMFIDSQELYPLQLRLRQYIIGVDTDYFTGDGLIEYNSETLKSATIIFATIPILMVYPFMQKHFVKGALLGSVK